MDNVVDIGIKRWADTCEMLVVLHGAEAVRQRTSALPSAYRDKVTEELKERAAWQKQSP